MCVPHLKQERELHCQVCGDTITAIQPTKRYCKRCTQDRRNYLKRLRRLKQHKQKNCEQCHQPFLTPYSVQKFCSKNCYQQYRKTKWKEDYYRRRESILKQKREYYKNNYEQLKESYKKHQHKLRMTVLNHYSDGKLECACCGENHIEFLQLHHINGDGRAERRSLNSNSSTALFRKIIKDNYPERYQILCGNCNFSHGAYGYCPHQKEKE